MYHWNGVKAGDIVSRCLKLRSHVSSLTSLQLSGKVRIPPQAAPIHEALHEAETGVAQHRQGNNLDTLLDENNRPLPSYEAAKLDLDEGEILKLPPTPETTDGTEHLSDPETTKLRTASRPGSGTSTPRRVPPVPPTLPPRSSVGAGASASASAAAAAGAGLRPPLDRNDSSASHYSDALDQSAAVPLHSGGGAVPPPADGPPGYEDPFAGGSGPSSGALAASAYPAEKTGVGAADIPSYDHSSSPSGYPQEKGPSEPNHEQSAPTSSHPSEKADAGSAPSYADHPPSDPATSGAVDTTQMTEGERREWEQYYADQELAQRAGQVDLNQGGAGSGTKADQQEHESLR